MIFSIQYMDECWDWERHNKMKYRHFGKNEKKNCLILTWNSTGHSCNDPALELIVSFNLCIWNESMYWTKIKILTSNWWRMLSQLKWAYQRWWSAMLSLHNLRCSSIDVCLWIFINGIVLETLGATKFTTLAVWFCFCLIKFEY